MTPRGTTGETAGTAGAGYLTPRAPHPYRARHLDYGEREHCTCGLGRDHATHRIPSPRAAEEEAGK